MKKKLISLAICGVLSFADNCFGMNPAYQMDALAQVTGGSSVAALASRKIVHAEGARKLTAAQVEVLRLEGEKNVAEAARVTAEGNVVALTNQLHNSVEKVNLAPFRSCNAISGTAPVVVSDLISSLSTIFGSAICEGLIGSDGTNDFLHPINAIHDVNLSDSLSIFIDSVGHSDGVYALATAGAAFALAAAAAPAPAPGAIAAPIAAPTAFVDVMSATITADSIASHYDVFATAIGSSDVDTAANFHIMAINNGQNFTDRRVGDLVAGLNAVNLTQVDSVATVAGADVKDVLLLGLLANAAIAELGSPDGGNIGGAAPVALGYTPEIINNIRGILAELHV